MSKKTHRVGSKKRIVRRRTGRLPNKLALSRVNAAFIEVEQTKKGSPARARAEKRLHRFLDMLEGKRS